MNVECAKVLRIAVIGSKDFNNYDFLKCTLNKLLNILRKSFVIEIISNGEGDIASFADKYANEEGFLFHKEVAFWGKYGKDAGYIRDDSIHEYLSRAYKRVILDFWDGTSKEPCYHAYFSKFYKTSILVYDYKAYKFVELKEAVKRISGKDIYYPPSDGRIVKER